MVSRADEPPMVVHPDGTVTVTIPHGGAYREVLFEVAIAVEAALLEEFTAWLAGEGIAEASLLGVNLEHSWDRGDEIDGGLTAPQPFGCAPVR